MWGRSLTPYRDRIHAGEELARLLSSYANAPDTLVLGLARGGIPVAKGIANRLHLPLDAVIVRKIGHPLNPEYAMGALTMDKTVLWNSDREAKRLDEAEKQRMIAREWQELERRNEQYRQSKPVPDVAHKTIILVDDGIATGASLLAALQTLQTRKAKSIILAVPVAPPEALNKLCGYCDKVICPVQPDNFEAVGLWYDDFSQTSDQDVIHALRDAASHSP
jgi:putative phosphoribosyl transferase